MATDNFNRANGGLGSNWGFAHGPLAIVSNTVKATTSTNSVAFRTAETYPADQYSQVVWQGGTTASGGGPVVRHDGADPGSYYLAFVNPEAPALYVMQVTDGSYNSAIFVPGGITLTPPIANGDVLRIEAVGTTITVKRNGITLYSGTNSAFATGRPGFEIYNTTVALDDWDGGSMAAGITLTAAAGSHSITGSTMVEKIVMPLGAAGA